MHIDRCTMSDSAEERWKLELVMLSTPLKKIYIYKQALTSAKLFVLRSEKLSINLLVMFSSTVLTCYPSIFYSMLCCVCLYV